LLKQASQKGIKRITKPGNIIEFQGRLTRPVPTIWAYLTQWYACSISDSSKYMTGDGYPLDGSLNLQDWGGFKMSCQDIIE